MNFKDYFGNEKINEANTSNLKKLKQKLNKLHPKFLELIFDVLEEEIEEDVLMDEKAQKEIIEFLKELIEDGFQDY